MYIGCYGSFCKQVDHFFVVLKMAIRSMDMEIEDNGMFVPYAEFREANAATSDILPSKSREIYEKELHGRVNRGPFVNPILERVAGLIKPSLEGLIRSIEDDTEGTDEHEAEKTEAVVLAEGSVGPNGVIKITGTADAPELLRTLLHPGVKRPTSSGNIGSTGSERLESCAEATTSTSGTPLAAAEEETAMASPTPSSQKMFNSNWSKFRRSVLNNLEEPLAKALRAKIESVQKNSQMASEEHLWKKELHNLRIEHEKEFHKIRLEKEVEMLKQEKAKADREQELLKQERIRTERILKQTFSS
ncbi:hypothetical protein C0J52_03400 [Blattella germanica]|nr:hypothetical protein C0J52_03400 [Blattella germanica]